MGEMVPSGSQGAGLRGPGLQAPEDLGVPGAQGPQCPWGPRCQWKCGALAGIPGALPPGFFENKNELFTQILWKQSYHLL